MAFFGSIGRALKNIVRQVEEQEKSGKKREDQKTPDDAKARKQVTKKQVLRAGIEAQSGIVRGVGVPVSKARAVRDMSLTQQLRTNARR